MLTDIHHSHVFSVCRIQRTTAPVTRSTTRLFSGLRLWIAQLVERWSSAGLLSLSYARLAAGGWPFKWIQWTRHAVSSAVSVQILRLGPRGHLALGLEINACISRTGIVNQAMQRRNHNSSVSKGDPLLWVLKFTEISIHYRPLISDNSAIITFYSQFKNLILYFIT